MAYLPMNWQGFLSSSWYQYLDNDHQAIIRTAVKLAENEALVGQLEDYSFIVFLFAKAYEAFLKTYLLNLNLIDENLYNSKKFRIGRALNPDVSANHRDEWWLYDDVSRQCGEEVAHSLWIAWLEGRNRVVHSFPGEDPLYSLEKMKKKITIITEAMDVAASCEQ